VWVGLCLCLVPGVYRRVSVFLSVSSASTLLLPSSSQDSFVYTTTLSCKQPPAILLLVRLFSFFSIPIVDAFDSLVIYWFLVFWFGYLLADFN